MLNTKITKQVFQDVFKTAQVCKVKPKNIKRQFQIIPGRSRLSNRVGRKGHTIWSHVFFKASHCPPHKVVFAGMLGPDWLMHTYVPFLLQEQDGSTDKTLAEAKAPPKCKAKAKAKGAPKAKAKGAPKAKAKAKGSPKKKAMAQSKDDASKQEKVASKAKAVAQAKVDVSKKPKGAAKAMAKKKPLVAKAAAKRKVL